MSFLQKNKNLIFIFDKMKMKKPFYISKETWEALSRKEQDFIYYLREKKYSKKQIMDKLYIETRQGYFLLNKRVSNKIKNDVNKVYKNNN